MLADKLKILVVDDSETARHYLCGLLDDLGLLKLLRGQGLDLPPLPAHHLSYGSLSTAVEAVRSGVDDYILRSCVETSVYWPTACKRCWSAATPAGSASSGIIWRAGPGYGRRRGLRNEPVPDGAIMASAELMQMTEAPPAPARTGQGGVVEQANRLGQVTQRLLKVVPFQTKSYVGDRVILELEASSESGEKS